METAVHRAPPTPLQTASRGPAYHTVAPSNGRPNQRASPVNWAARVDNRVNSTDPRVGLAGNHGRLKSTWASQTWAQALPPAGPPQPFLHPTVRPGHPANPRSANQPAAAAAATASYSKPTARPAAGGASVAGGIYTERRNNFWYGQVC